MVRLHHLSGVFWEKLIDVVRRLSFVNRPRTVFVWLLGAALVAGPAAAACVDCCPAADAQAAVVAPLGCCDDCGPELERLPDSASLTSKALVGSDLFAVCESVPDAAPSLTFESTRSADISDLSTFRTPRTPLRL